MYDVRCMSCTLYDVQYTVFHTMYVNVHYMGQGTYMIYFVPVCLYCMSSTAHCTLYNEQYTVYGIPRVPRPI